MKPWGLPLVALALAPACSSPKPPPPREEPPTAAESAAPPQVAVLFERVSHDGSQPLFGPDGGITVGSRRWDRDGRYLGRHAWAVSGQLRPVAVGGDADHPLVLAAGWSELEGMPARPQGVDDDAAWLIAAAPGATKPAHAAPIAHEFLDDGFALSPDRSALAVIEGDEVVVHALPAGNVLARGPLGETEDAPLACWIDDARLAWTAREGGGTVLRTFAFRTRATESTKLAAPVSLAACDPAGGAAAVTLEAGAIGVLDLTTGALLASVAVGRDAEDNEVELAVGERGARLAVASASSLSLYHRDGARLASIFTHAMHGGPAKLQFSPDGQRLAVAGRTLVVLGPKAEARVRPPAPHLVFELPEGFTSMPPSSPEQVAWAYAQLPAPSGFTGLPALLVNAVGDRTEVIGVALDRDEFSDLPAPDATDAQLASFAKRAMAQVFANWVDATIGTTRDADFTLRVGRTDGMPWAETREVVRDGCEPYDGYTRIVVARDVVFVIRALTVPNGPTDGWLTRFFDLPFGVRTQTARRAGPRTGPC